MGNVIQTTGTIIICVEFMIGKVGNGFIVLVNFIDWVKRRKISLADQILTALAISRIAVLWLVFTNWWISTFYPTLYMVEKTLRIFNVVWVVTNHFSIWLATCLSIFYFLKIANFSNSVFLYLKWRVKKVVSVILLVSLVFFFFNIILINIHINAWFDVYKGNMTCTASLINYVQFSHFLLLTNASFTFIPFVVTLITFLLLMSSLWKHLRTMQRDAQGPRDASTKAHITTMKSIIAFLLLYAIFFLSYIIPAWNFDFWEKRLTIMFCQLAALAFPSGHSCVLILVNHKLRQTSLLVLWWLRCRLKGGDSSGP
ncbi:taste receptor type 2 member 14-like [Tupaia chinensis]|uniref:taste receptor type 2 member 14-like n=1 Tax=Tupaia chinensis TaxID=246437 RepID=UPI0003C8D743|nr:taste receptor type 2 member 14-like [Tupaia chinensis]